jgi:hypothetical protein
MGVTSRLVRWSITTAPVAEPVALADVKAHLVIDGSQDDALLTSLITVAREACEDVTGRFIAPCSVRYTLDWWPQTASEWWDGVREMPISATRERATFVELPRPPLISVSAVTAYSDADVPTVWDTANYFVDTSDPNQPGRLCLRTGHVWPVALRNRNAVTIDATVGYATVPASLCRAIMMMVADLYSNRGDGWSASLLKRGGSNESDSANRSGAMALLERYVVRSL